jgi:hypothetical protein
MARNPTRIPVLRSIATKDLSSCTKEDFPLENLGRYSRQPHRSGNTRLGYPLGPRGLSCLKLRRAAC